MGIIVPYCPKIMPHRPPTNNQSAADAPSNLVYWRLSIPISQVATPMSSADDSPQTPDPVEKNLSPLVLSRYQALELLKARKAGQTAAESSTDLNHTRTAVTLDPDGLTFANGTRARWDSIEAIAQDETHCFAQDSTGEFDKIMTFSRFTRRAIVLYATPKAPTMVLAGFPMHRIKNTDPWADTQAKARAGAPLSGEVLDTCTGLGYTATLASQTAQRVITCELDPGVLEVCARNPWSQALFDSPKITPKIGDILDLIEDFEDGQFNRIIHDPPTVAIAGDLYSGDFYRQLLRVTRKGGRVFHYIGDPRSELGARTTRGVVRRLQEVGFREVRPAEAAFGVIATR